MSNPRVIDDSKKLWERLATDAAPIGKRAVEEHVRKWADSLGVQIRNVVVVKLDGPGEYKVGVNYMGCGWDAKWEVYEFAVRNPNIISKDYEHNVEFIRHRQEYMAPHLRGLPHNVHQFLNDKIVELVNRVTGYSIAVGDIWVHSCDTLEDAKAQPGNEGMVAFGALTRAGQIAFDKFLEVRGIRVPGPDEEQKWLTSSHGPTQCPPSSPSPGASSGTTASSPTPTPTS